MPVLQAKASLFIRETKFLRLRPHRRDFRGRAARAHQFDGRVQIFAASLIRVDHGPRCKADCEGAVVARPVTHIRMENVVVRRIARPKNAVRENVRVRIAAFAGNRVHRFHIFRTQIVQQVNKITNNKITPDGLPVLLIENAPPEIKSPGFKLTRPEIYYGESTQDPVFVHTAREEFDYPQGDQNKYSTYQGTGGFPVGSFFLKAAAAISQGEPNILFTGYLTGQSRMMIYRKVEARLGHLAGFLQWDPDPYLVVTDDGRLVWMVDGYTTSLSHPYSATLPVTGVDEGANYIRNAVKATVDAYTGKISLYVFDPSDPIIQVYENLFPKLFQPASQMPADLRRHARYPEVLFRTQAEAYRVFHMRDPQVFYNKEDIWEIAHSLLGQSSQPEPMQPTYVVATLPGEKNPEFLLILPFTPRGKDNLIGWMAARCDGDQLGNLIFFQLSKQQLMYGPMQIESRIDQDQNISKDLTLWNQQGSHVLRGNVIALPVTGGFLYVESIYIQASEARMPQLKKVVLAMGDRLIYRDTFEQALAELTAGAAAPRNRRFRRRFSNARSTVGARIGPGGATRSRRPHQPPPRSGRAARQRSRRPRKGNPEKIAGTPRGSPIANREMSPIPARGFISH